MITRQQYIFTEYASDEAMTAAHNDYYAQFVTQSVKLRLEAFLQAGGDINVLRQVDCLAASAPTDVVRLMAAAGDYPTLGGMVCVYKRAYELREAHK